MIAKVVVNFDEKFKKLDDDFDAALDAKLDAILDAKLDAILNEKLDAKLNQLNDKFDVKFNQINDKLNDRINTNQRPIEIYPGSSISLDSVQYSHCQTTSPVLFAQKLCLCIFSVKELYRSSVKGGKGKDKGKFYL